MNGKKTVCSVLSLLAMAAVSAVATEGPPPTLTPKTYASPSGVYSLAVDPTDLHGRGAADYQLNKDGKKVWASRLPYTFWEAAVTDSGQVAGYGYTHGWRGFSEGGWNAGPGDFVVAILAADGKALNEEKGHRQWSNFLDTPPDPLVTGIVLDGANNRFVLRVRDPDINRRIEQWRVFDLKSGRQTGALEPGRSMPEKTGDESRFMLGARAVPGTSLVLTHWWEYAPGKCGGLFTLVDLNDTKAKPVWSLCLDGDYSVPGDDGAEGTIRNMIWKEGAILDVNKTPGFAIRAVKQGQRIAFSVEKAGDGAWQVRETARTPYEPPAAKPGEKFAQIKAEEVAVVRLDGKGRRKESPIRGIEGFGFDAEGRICALSVRKDADPHLLRVTQEGEVLQDLRVPVGELPDVVKWSNPVSVGNGRFVVTVSDGSEDGKARCFVADFRAATVKEVAGFDSFAITALAGFPDGRFAALIYHRVKYTAGQGLSLFDAQGKRIWWKEDSGYTGKPEELLSPEDITRYGDDSIAVLDKIRHTVMFFDTKGVFLRSINLNKTWKRQPSYPTHVVEDSKGGLAIYDFDAQFPLVRMDAKGRIQSECAPKFSDGKPLKVHGMQRSSDGRLWVTDGDVLLRLSDNGTVDRTLGEEATSHTLYQPGHAIVGPDDRIYVADQRTNTIHVFDGNGRMEGVCVPDAKDLTETSYVQHLAASADANVFVSLGFKNDTNAYVRFDKNLKRIGTVEIKLDSVSQDWYFQPSGSLCWIGAYEDVYLVKDLQKVVRKISRRPDRQWLESPASVGVAPDGSAAVIACSRAGEVSVSTYGPTGDPRATYVGPRGWSRWGNVAYDGQSVFFRSESDLYIIGPDNRCAGVCRLPETAKKSWEGPFLAAGGKQLWFVDREGPAVHKFAIPHVNVTPRPRPEQ